jgi:two-component system, response regulator PdtaR
VQTYPTVLIVEDEPILRFYEMEIAEGAGFLTLMASNAEEALKELEGPIAVQILLTDASMPGSMDGFELASTVRHRWPEIKIVIASDQVDRKDAEIEPECVFVPKPFTPNQLTSALLSVV